MSRKRKLTTEERAKAAKACAEGRMSAAEAARRFGVAKSTVREWAIQYEENGTLALGAQKKNNVYSAELKRQAVEAYLTGKGSKEKITAKYGLRSVTQLKDWMKVYNSSRDFGRRMSGGSRMKHGRETTQEERVTIVKDCLKNGSNYGETAILSSIG